jgi:hypothetical protein
MVCNNKTDGTRGVIEGIDLNTNDHLN